MSRRNSKHKKETKTDLEYFDCIIMLDGKKELARRMRERSFAIIQKSLPDHKAEDIFNFALDNIKPTVEVKGRRVGGANYQVPVDVSPLRARTLASKWLVGAARKRSGKSFEEKLAMELIDASGISNDMKVADLEELRKLRYERTSKLSIKGGAFKKLSEVLSMAKANQAFASIR